MGEFTGGRELTGDLPAITKILIRSNDVRDTDGLLALIKSEVADLLRHEAMICGYHLMTSAGSYVHHFLQYNYPADYIEELRTSEDRVNSPLMQRWRATQEPVLFQAGRDDGEYPKEWVDIFKRHGLRNTIGHGILDVRGTFGSYFIFSSLAAEVGIREKKLLKVVTPHLHLALMRTVETAEESGKNPGAGQWNLSARQQEILRWISLGKTNKEIAQLLSMTEKNVNYHLEKIFSKLEVRSRAQAASAAMLRGI